MGFYEECLERQNGSYIEELDGEDKFSPLAEINTKSAIEGMRDFSRNLNFEHLDGSYIIKFSNGIFEEGVFNEDGSYVGEIHTTNLRENVLNDFVSNLPKNVKKDEMVVRDHFLSVSYVIEPEEKDDGLDFVRGVG